MARPALCHVSLCTGCSACQSVCPASCIAMVADAGGFLCPEIDAGRCIECGRCEQICPVLHRPALERTAEPKVYACWHKDTETRARSSSGGAFSALAETVLARGGVVFGASYDEGLYVRHIHIEAAEDLDRLRRSKYVQSDVGTSFPQVEAFLKAGREVLFVGTPCQVAGLHAFLGGDAPGLLTVDFICHGVPSAKIFRKYLDSCEQFYRVKFANFNFRDKRRGWLNFATTASSSQQKPIHLKGSKNSYYYGFVNGMTLRSSCYKCPVIGLPRFGKITIADYWGIQQDANILPDEIQKGISLMMVNSPHDTGDMLEVLSGRMTIIERTLSEAKNGNAPMCVPASMPPQRENFFRDLDACSYDVLVDKYLEISLKRRLIQFIKENFSSGAIARARTFKARFSGRNK